jgi:hypothetical protein
MADLPWHVLRPATHDTLGVLKRKHELIRVLLEVRARECSAIKCKSNEMTLLKPCIACLLFLGTTTPHR